MTHSIPSKVKNFICFHKRKIMQFFSLIVYVLILNSFFSAIGFLFIEHYSNHVDSQLDWNNLSAELVLCSIYAVFQIFVFPIDKKKGPFFMSWLNLTLAYVILNDCSGWDYGSDIWFSIVSLLSKFNHVLGVFLHNLLQYNDNDFLHFLFFNNYTFIFCIYLLIVGYSFKFIFNKFIWPTATKMFPFLENCNPEAAKTK